METKPVNETIRAIKSRFSCRSFSDRPVADDVISAIVDAGKYAPSGKNAQGWHFTVLRTDEGKALLLTAAGKTPPEDFPEWLEWPYQSDFCGAPVVILVSADPNVPWPDVGAVLAAGNMMTAASSLGLATLWSSAFTRDIFRDEESRAVKPRLVPDGYVMKAALFLGYPETAPEERPPRREGVETWL